MLKKNSTLKRGYNPISNLYDLDWNDSENTQMNFGILKMSLDDTFSLNNELEKAILLMHGNISLTWNENTIKIIRNSFFDDNPTVLLVPSTVQVKITCLNSESELCIVETKNDKQYPYKLYTAEECLTEQFGKGTLRETSTRDVRTIFDKNNMPESNLVLADIKNLLAYN